MRDKMGILIVEEESGSVGIQVFEDPDAASESFKELKGRVGEAKKRATFFKIGYNGDGSVKSVSATAKDLPMPVVDTSDGYIIGEGPRKDMK